MKVIVIEAYERPYENPISVTKGERVSPDLSKPTDIEGWVWCTAQDGRSGWTPTSWLMRSNKSWRIDRDFNAIELTIARGEILDIILEESGFYLARKDTGETGWVPGKCVSDTHRA